MLDMGTVLSDRYEIKEKIGAGGMSIVYRAKCRKLQRYVAIKVLRDEFAQDEIFVSKFKAEALSAASLSHPNIVGIYDVGHDNGYHYIVMEYVEGKTLKDLIDAEAPYDTQTVLEYGMEIVSAIGHAHRKKIIHRDIKPQNILVTNDRILKVTDFGIARAVDSATIVSTGTAIGSVHYFSPEQAKGKYVDETSDLYSCGIVLFELATGRLPFDADSHVSVALKHINEELPLPSSINKNISPALEAIILKATQKRPELRYQSSEDMLQDMKNLSLNPSYKINLISSQINQPTILMTPEETDYIRKNSSENQELSIPNWQSTNPNKILYTANNVYDPIEEEDEDAEEVGEVSSTYTLMVTIAGVLAAVVLIGIVTAFALPWFSKMNQPEVAVVPHLIGKDVESATEALKEKQLELVVVSEEYREGVPAGQIIIQAPNRDELVPLNTEVEVIVSKAQETTAVPDVTGKDFSDAQLEIRDADLKVEIERIYSDKVEQGRVISQYPMPRETVALGETVSLVVSKGPEIIKVIVPNVVDTEENIAKQTIRNSGLAVGQVTYEDNDTIEKGKVISQTVPSGREVEQGTSVSIVISNGKKAEEPPKPSIKNLTIHVPAFLEQKETYHLFIRLNSENGESKTIYDGEVALEEFPVPVSVKGSGKGTVETYIDGERVYADPIDFDEVTQ